MSYPAAFDFVKHKRPCIKPNPGFVAALLDWEAQWFRPNGMRRDMGLGESARPGMSRSSTIPGMAMSGGPGRSGHHGHHGSMSSMSSGGLPPMRLPPLKNLRCVKYFLINTTKRWIFPIDTRHSADNVKNWPTSVAQKKKASLMAYVVFSGITWVVQYL
jgi:hypothetical protein